MKTINSKTHVFKLGIDKPALYIDSGEIVKVKTLDCYGNKLSECKYSNPATGPIYINDARKKDTLKITIKQITISSKGIIEVGSGIIKSDIHYQDVVIDCGYAVYNDLRIPITPMIGVIGVASQYEAISTISPGTHGGNLDCKEIKENSIIYLPVFHDGAYLSLGDLHALMGDGEISGSGLEVAGEVILKIELLKNFDLHAPLVISDELLYFIASDVSMDEAIRCANKLCLEFLLKYENYNLISAMELLALIGNIGICQLVNPLKTVKLSIPLKYLKNSNLL